MYTCVVGYVLRIGTTCHKLLHKLSNRSRLALDGKPERDDTLDTHRDNTPVHDKWRAVVLVVDSFACGEWMNQTKKDKCHAVALNNMLADWYLRRLHLLT